MHGVVKFSEASSIALHTLAVLAGDPDHLISAHEVAGLLPISENHLAKVLQRLARAGLVESVRGPGGGFRLRRDPAGLTLLEVHEAIEGPFTASPCMFDPPKCCGDCILGDTLHTANALVKTRLAQTHLADLAHLFPPRGAEPSTTEPPAAHRPRKS